jgi:hypothetical protein
MRADPANRCATAWRPRPHGRGESASPSRVTTPAATPRKLERKDRLMQRLIVPALLTAVIGVDQAAKW